MKLLSAGFSSRISIFPLIDWPLKSDYSGLLTKSSKCDNKKYIVSCLKYAPRYLTSGGMVEVSPTLFENWKKYSNCVHLWLNPLSPNPTKWSNTLKQFVDNLPTNCLNVFDHFVKLALKGLKAHSLVWDNFGNWKPFKNDKK